MDMFILICGILNMVFALINATENIASKILFKAIPFLMGLGLTLIGLNMMGILQLNF